MTTTNARYHERKRDERMSQARSVHGRMTRRPERYDTPNVRCVLARHVEAARLHNWLAIRHRITP